MQFAWFVYAIALMAVAIVACAVAMVVWVLAGRRDCLSAAVGFALYLFDVGAILFDEYMRRSRSATHTSTAGSPIRPFRYCSMRGC